MLINTVVQTCARCFSKYAAWEQTHFCANNLNRVGVNGGSSRKKAHPYKHPPKLLEQLFHRINSSAHKRTRFIQLYVGCRAHRRHIRNLHICLYVRFISFQSRAEMCVFFVFVCAWLSHSLYDNVASSDNNACKGSHCAFAYFNVFIFSVSSISNELDNWWFPVGDIVVCMPTMSHLLNTRRCPNLLCVMDLLN